MPSSVSKLDSEECVKDEIERSVRENGELYGLDEAQPPPLNGGGGGIAARSPGAKMIAPGTPFYPLFPFYPASQS